MYFINHLQTNERNGVNDRDKERESKSRSPGNDIETNTMMKWFIPKLVYVCVIQTNHHVECQTITSHYHIHTKTATLMTFEPLDFNPIQIICRLLFFFHFTTNKNQKSKKGGEKEIKPAIGIQVIYRFFYKQKNKIIYG